MSATQDKAFSSLDFVGQCLFDLEKARLFDAAIRAVVRPEHTVLDVGTGSGILALFAARAGAKKVVALEFDPLIAAIARKNFEQNGFGETIQIVIGDARNHRFDSGTRFDVVTMEMLSTGMIDEMQVQASNNLLATGAASAGTIFLPAAQETLISLAEVNFNLFGFDMRMVLHVWKIFENIKTLDLTETKPLNEIAFNHAIGEEFDRTVAFKVIKSGVINAIWLRSRAQLGPDGYLDNTISVNPPVAIPLPERQVRCGEEIALRVRYRFGHGWDHFESSFI